MFTSDHLMLKQLHVVLLVGNNEYILMAELLIHKCLQVLQCEVIFHGNQSS